MLKSAATATLLAALMCGGCAHVTIPEALDVANKGLAGAGLAVQGSKALVDEATELKLEQCGSKPPGDARRECMGVLGKPVAPGYEKAAAAYDAAVLAIEAFEAAYEDLKPAIEAAREVVGR